jgi:hypothetical protein
MIITFHMPDGRSYAHAFTGLQVLSLGEHVIVEWAERVDEEIRRGCLVRPPTPPRTFAGALLTVPTTYIEQETEAEAAERIAAFSASSRPGGPPRCSFEELERRITASEVAMRERMSNALFSGVTVTPSTYATWGTAYIINTAAFDPLRGLTPQTFITDEVNTMPTPTPTTPNEGMPVLQEPTAYLGMPVQRTQNVRVNAVTIQATMAGRRTIFVNPNTPTGIWQEEVRRQLARLVQRSAPVSIKQTCRYCGKAYPARQGMSTDPSPYCSDRCAAAAADFTDCPACGGTGRAAGNPSGEKCGECYGSSYKPCDSCQEDHARLSLMFTNPSTGTVYYVCPACVADEREAGGVQAPQASV